MIYSILIYGVGFVVALVLVVYGIGSVLPVEHTSSLEKTFPVPAKTVYALIRNVREYPSWRSNLKSIEEISSVSWKETDSNRETTTYSFVRDEKDRLLESKIMDEDKPFGGSWTFELIPVDGGVKLEITENGRVFSPIFRFFSKYVFGHTATIRAYLEQVDRRIQGP
ncbi:polyketide cyclase [Leptospira gomenensis]|uniref:Polyketide cyclase n=1 Tax=Leptospira gomenensis TaxID=2484974 RepID=A0A5F1YAN3_9LEPT|nr:SRPBCC family protein [Leptospira gomenensis]TGK33369.1 polyketide cyclase [Leptospira gomenensis]TGK37336.1 polyketide cyclase [Leptospira gomenensis]TGK40525.1 polyketide cyclase [Leptospira gomenensis]TGK56447.1 polyketide cyclase [Leptospira gomenensis]